MQKNKFTYSKYHFYCLIKKILLKKLCNRDNIFKVRLLSHFRSPFGRHLFADIYLTIRILHGAIGNESKFQDTTVVLEYWQWCTQWWFGTGEKLVIPFDFGFICGFLCERKQILLSNERKIATFAIVKNIFLFIIQKYQDESKRN